MRFRKRVKIAKGFYMNLSGSGASLSFGPRGASVTIGKKGTYLNTVIPGTGIYNRQKISGSTANKTPSYSNISSSQLSDVKIELYLDEKGNPILKLTDSFGREITDGSIIRKVKRDEQYKNDVEKLMNSKRNEIENNLKSFIEIYKSTPKLFVEEEIQKKLLNLSPQKYEKLSYDKSQPSLDDVKLELKSESKQKINSILFWKNKKLREEYIINNTQERFQDSFDKWTKKKNEFDFKQEQTEKDQNDFYLNQFLKAKSELENYLNGDDDYISSKIETILNEITLPVEFSIDYEYDKNNSILYIDLDLPEIEDMPKEKVNTLSSGKISIKEKTQKEIKQEYASCVCGISFYFTGLFFNISSQITTIQISGYSQRIKKKTGSIEDEYIYSIKFDRLTFEKLNFDKIDPIEAVSNFESRMSITSSYDLKTIIPLKKL